MAQEHRWADHCVRLSWELALLQLSWGLALLQLLQERQALQEA